MASKSKLLSSSSSSRWYYLLAILPLPILIIASQFLNTTISSPASDHGSGSMFDLIATRYDFINRALALNLDMGWRHRLVEEALGENCNMLSIDGSTKILDLATGTADVAILLGKAVEKCKGAKSKSTVLGLDPSQNMLNVGETKIQKSDLSNVVTLQLGDARKLDSLEDNTFGVATMSFGIRNVPEKEQALCEIYRVLKTDSHGEPKLAIMEFSEPGPDTGIMGSMARLFIRHLVPAMGAVLSGHPKEYMHLQKSIKDFPTPPQFERMMKKLRCPVKDDDGEVMPKKFGAFEVTEIVNLNFGSVQIYVATPITKTVA